jgi:hypothetical protein
MRQPTFPASHMRTACMNLPIPPSFVNLCECPDHLFRRVGLVGIERQAHIISNRAANCGDASDV